jgi:hypothetical protein
MKFKIALALLTLSGSLGLAQSNYTTTDSDNPGGVKANGITNTNGQQIISSAFDPKEFKWDIAWPGRISQSVKSNIKNSRQVISGNPARIKTKVNEVLMILPEGKDLTPWSVVNEKPLANENVKYHSSGKTRLGIPRMF